MASYPTPPIVSTWALLTIFPIFCLSNPLLLMYPKTLFPPSMILISFLLVLMPANSSSPNGTTRADDEPQTKRTVDQALELAGDNRAEIEQAIAACNDTELERKAIQFLVEHMPPADLLALKADFLVANVKLAIQARNDHAWAKRVPEEIFLNDVLPYASINERRDNWRKDFYEKFKGLVAECQTTGQAAQELNKNVFRILNVKYSTGRKKPDQSPYESMETGLASCTGLSVILVDACRAVGVPARLAGTPLWVNKRGNHTWVEVWDEGQWKFTGACEYDPQGLNRGWFQGIASQADADNPLHRIYATSWQDTGGHFPMVWKRQSKEVPGVDVTWRYTGQPRPLKKGHVRVAIQLYGADGQRLAGKLTVRQGDLVLGSGESRDESNDANDYFEIDLPPGTYEVQYPAGDKTAISKLEVSDQANPIHQIRLGK